MNIHHIKQRVGSDEDVVSTATAEEEHHDGATLTTPLVPDDEEATGYTLMELDDSINVDDDDSEKRAFGANDLRLIWKIFQVLVWPFADIVIPLSGATRWLMIAVSYIIVFYLVARKLGGNILNKFGWWDFSPTAFWIAIIFLGSDVVVIFLILLLLSVFVLLASRKTLLIKLSGAADASGRLVGRLSGIPKLEEEAMADDEETADDVAVQVQDLGPVEDLARAGQLKKPWWVYVIMFFMVIWQVIFLLCLYSSALDGKSQFLAKARENYVDGFSLDMALHDYPRTVNAAKSGGNLPDHQVSLADAWIN